MTDCGDLEKLPPEIRKEIYALVLVQAEPLELCNFGGDQKKIGESSGRGRHAPKMKNEWARSGRATKVAPVGHKRHRKGIGHQHIGSRWFEVPSNVALLCVNKRIHTEAAPVLYSRTKFRFQNSNTMSRFLNLIGDNIQHLRDVGISGDGWEYRRSLCEARRSLQALAAAKSIRTFEVSRHDVSSDGLGSHRIVGLCRPLLDSLKVAYENNDLKASILEVIKIKSVRRPCRLYAVRRRKTQQAIEKDRTKQKLEHKRCVAEYRRHVAEHNELQRELKHWVAEQHDMEVGS